MRTLLRLAVPALAGLVSLAAQAADARVHVTPYAPLFQELPTALGVRTGELVRRELAAQDGVSVVEVAAVEAAGPGVEAAQALERARTLAQQGWTALEPPAPSGETEEAPAAGGPVLPAQSGPVLPASGDDATEPAGEAAPAPAPQPDPALAASRFQAALRLLDQHPEVLGDLSLLVELHRGRAIALTLAGQASEAEASLAALARVSPAPEHDWGAAEGRLAPAWDRVRSRLLSARRGEVEVRSTPRGAEVRLDGRGVGRTPVRLTGLVPGAHWLEVRAGHARPWIRPLEVVAGEAGEVSVELEPTLEGPEATLVAALADNVLDEEALAAAVAAGRAREAAWVVTGGLSRIDDAYQVRSFLVSVEEGTARALPDMRLDLEFIGAAIEVYGVASAVKDRMASGEPLALPVTLFPDARRSRPDAEVVQAGPAVPKSGPVLPGAAAEPAQTAAAGEDDGVDDGAAVAEAAEPPKPAGPVGPIGPQAPKAEEPQRRERTGPLAAGAIEIDEEADDEASASGPVGPVGPVGPATPVDEEAEVEEETPRERQVASISGDRQRLDLGEEGDVNRFSAVDVEDIVIPKDEVGEERGWPWWAYGLVAAGVIAAGAGGYFVAQEAGVFGGTPTDATVNIRW